MARRVTSPVLVGRSDLVDQLESAVRDSIGGRPRHAVIGGEAGVGKTRLLAEARARAEAAGARVLLGGCVSMGGEGLPFAPYTEIIRALVAEDGAPAVVAAAGRAAPDLARLVPALDTGEPAPDQELWAQTRLYEALFDLFGRLAQRQPLMIQIEDLHWADAGTLAATSYLLRAIEAEPITLVATFRADELTRRHPVRPWLAEVVRSAIVERIELAPLERDDVAALVRNILEEDLPDHAVAEIHDRSDGNPFYIEELLCCRVEYDESMPASLRDVLLSRVYSIPEEAQELLGVAAVGGREMEHEMLVAVAGEEDGARSLRRLVDDGLLLPTRAPDGDDAYSFRHALLREVIYDELLPSERRRLHQRWGEYLEGHGSDADDGPARQVQLAHHWREARDPRALAASIAAGDGAMASFAYPIASREYGEALALWGGPAADDLDLDRAQLLERGSRASYLASDFRRASAWCREAVEALGDSDPARKTDLLILLARTLWVSGDWGTATDTYEQALATAPAEPPIVRVRAEAGLGQAYMLSWRPNEARRLCESALEGAIAIGALDLEGHCRNTLGVVLTGAGEIDAGIASIDAALRIALELGIPDDIGRAYVNKVDIEYWAGHPERALETAATGMRVAEEWGVGSSYGAYIAYGGISAAFDAGAWDRALELMAWADRKLDPMASTFLYRATYVAQLLAGRGDDRFERLWDRALRLVLEQPPSDHSCPLFLAGIEHSAFAGNHAAAAELAQRSAEQIASLDRGYHTRERTAELARVAAWPLVELGRAARASGDEAELERVRERLAAFATQPAGRDQPTHPTHRLAKWRSLDADELEAFRLRLDGLDTADHWRDLADGWAGEGRPYRAATARWRQAEAAERDEARDTAVKSLREAHHIALELGARPLLDQLETIARRMRVRLGGSAPAGGAPDRAYGLTPRELEVLVQVAAGHTNREIAETLFVSESTAGVHVSNILGKLGVSTRTEAARVALDQGLVGGTD